MPTRSICSGCASDFHRLDEKILRQAQLLIENIRNHPVAIDQQSLCPTKRIRRRLVQMGQRPLITASSARVDKQHETTFGGKTAKFLGPAVINVKTETTVDVRLFPRLDRVELMCRSSETLIRLLWLARSLLVRRNAATRSTRTTTIFLVMARRLWISWTMGLARGRKCVSRASGWRTMLEGVFQERLL